MCTREEEQTWVDRGLRYIVGMDEAGAGALAGPVTIGACYLPLQVDLPGINDSKKLTPRRRERLYEALIQHSDVKYVTVHIDPATIDRINILQARFEGFYQAYLQMKAQLPAVEVVLLDGNQCPPQLVQAGVNVRTLVGGDGKVACIGAASILAKVTRDRLMVEQDRQYPVYGWAGNKGYPQPLHLEALRQWGPSPLHRRTFRGVVGVSDSPTFF